MPIKAGKSLLKKASSDSRLSRSLIAAAGIGAIGSGLVQGIGERDVSSNAYDLLFDDPNIDNYVFGRDTSIRQLFAPMPLGPTNTIKRGGIQGFSAAVSTGFVNPTTVGDHFKNSRYYDDRNIDFSNRMPVVDGSIVFGAYNSRQGG